MRRRRHAPHQSIHNGCGNPQPRGRERTRTVFTLRKERRVRGRDQLTEGGTSRRSASVAAADILEVSAALQQMFGWRRRRGFSSAPESSGRRKPVSSAKLSEESINKRRRNGEPRQSDGARSEVTSGDLPTRSCQSTLAGSSSTQGSTLASLLFGSFIHPWGTQLTDR